MTRRRYMQAPLVTHVVKAPYQDGVEVLVNDKSVGFISDGKVEWLSPKYKGTVEIQLVNPKTVTIETETFAQIALIYYCVDNSLEAYLKPYEQYTENNSSLGRSMLCMKCFDRHPVLQKDTIYTLSLVTTSQSIINVTMPVTSTTAYVIDSVGAEGSVVDQITDMTYSYNGEIYSTGDYLSFGRGYGDIKVVSGGVEYYVNITNN